jgi:hypothetical protein
MLDCRKSLAFPINSAKFGRNSAPPVARAGAGGCGALSGIFWDPEVVEQKQVTLLEPPGTLDQALKNTQDMIRHWELRGYGHWSVIEKVTGQVIGCVAVYHPQREWRSRSRLGVPPFTMGSRVCD